MQSNNWAIVTGASSGIGAAILRRIASKERNLNLLGVGRNLARLKDVQQSIIDSSNVHIVSADLSTPEGIAAVASALPPKACVKYLVHNAALFAKIAPLIEMDNKQFRDAISINLEAPLFLTKALLPNLKRCATKYMKPRILHVSSGAAHVAYDGWGSYCITKAGLNMMYKVLATELSHENILVGSVRPGVVDTPMQVTIRLFDGPTTHFPAQSKFIDLHSQGKLVSPDTAAAYLHWLLNEINDDEFSREEWDIRLSEDDCRWKEYLALNS
jgi:NAD(P)-dependent dehydrogenase (short-subunit alcohol dehydrogenase family)